MTSAVAIRDVADVTSGQGAPQDPAAFGDEGHPFLRAGSLQALVAGGDEDQCEHISDAKAAEYRLRLFPANTVVFAKSGMSATLGRVYRLKKPAYLVSHLAAIVPGPALDPGYLQRWLEKNPPSRLIPNEAYPSIRTTVIGAQQMTLPDINEQRRIAAILDKADAIRRRRQQSIKLADDFLRSVFLEMFGDPRSNSRGWPRQALGTMVSIDAPMVDPTVDEYSKLIHIGPDRIEKETGRLMPARTAGEERLKSGKFLFEADHVLYTKIRPYLRKVALPDFRGLCSADMYPVRPHAWSLTREFLWAVLISPAFVAYFDSLPDRASIPKINREEMGTYQCIKPPIELQQRYSEVFVGIHRLKHKLEEALAQSALCQSSLVSSLFSEGNA